MIHHGAQKVNSQSGASPPFRACRAFPVEVLCGAFHRVRSRAPVSARPAIAAFAGVCGKNPPSAGIGQATVASEQL